MSLEKRREMKRRKYSRRWDRFVEKVQRIAIPVGDRLGKVLKELVGERRG